MKSIIKYLLISLVLLSFSGCVVPVVVETTPTYERTILVEEKPVVFVKHPVIIKSYKRRYYNTDYYYHKRYKPKYYKKRYYKRRYYEYR